MRGDNEALEPGVLKIQFTGETGIIEIKKGYDCADFLMKELRRGEKNTGPRVSKGHLEVLSVWKVLSMKVNVGGVPKKKPKLNNYLVRN